MFQIISTVSLFFFPLTPPPTQPTPWLSFLPPLLSSLLLLSSPPYLLPAGPARRLQGWHPVEPQIKVSTSCARQETPKHCRWISSALDSSLFSDMWTDRSLCLFLKKGIVWKLLWVWCDKRRFCIVTGPLTSPCSRIFTSLWATLTAARSVSTRREPPVSLQSKESRRSHAGSRPHPPDYPRSHYSLCGV